MTNEARHTKLDELKAEAKHRKAYHTQMLNEFIVARDLLQDAADAMNVADQAVITELKRLVGDE